MKTIGMPLVASVLVFGAFVAESQENALLESLLDSPAPAAAPKPVEKKAVDASKPVEKKVVDAPKPVEKKAVDAPKPVEKKAVDAPKPVEKNVVDAPKPVEKKAVDAPKPVEKKVVDAPKPAEVTDELAIETEDDETTKQIVTLSNPGQSIKVPVDPAAHATGTEIAAKFLKVDETALVDIVSDDAPLSDILRQFRKTTGANIIYAESTNLQQRVSVSLRHVPWLQAMTSILNSRGFRVESTGDIHFIKEDKLVDPLFTRSFLLNHAAVDDLAKLFNDSYGIKGTDGKVIKPVATAFPGANTVVVTAPERVLVDCEKIIKAVDKAVPQIYIEARFIELSNQSLHKLGVQWNQLESWGASVRDVSAGIEYNNGRLGKYGVIKETSSSSTMSNDGTSSNSSSSQSVTSKDFALSELVNPEKITDQNNHTPDMGWRNARAFSGQLSADDFSIAMSAFEKLEDARIFSNPKVIVSNGREALVDMTTKYPNITLTSQHDTQSGYTKSDAKLEVIPGEDKLFAKSAFFSWGITLTVKPRISPDGLISVEIVPSISELDTDVTPNGFYTITGGTDAPYGTYPIIKYKRLTTDFTMKDGSTAVIGGLSKTEEGDIDSGIPYLRDIPWIGNKLFGWKSRGKVQKEIIVFVTVGIADPADLPEDIGLPKNAVRGREYVERRAQEPGDRPKAAVEALKLDMRPMDVQRREYGNRTGITRAPKAPSGSH